jgi:hypothetical protein
MKMVQSPSNKYVYWKQEAKERKWWPIPDTLQDREKAIKHGAMFFTWASLSELYKGNGKPEPVRYGDFPLDFDSNDINEALKDIKALCFYHLPKLYGIDPNAIQYFLSGLKGFHAIIPARLFAAQGGNPYTPLIYKKIAQRWKEQFQLETLDLSLYCMGKGKMFRIANVKRSNGHFKVPLMMEELQILEPEKLTELGRAPREIYQPEVDLDSNIDLSGLFQTCRDEIHIKNEKKNSKPPATAGVLPQGLPDCIRYIITKEPKTANSTFNKLVVNLVTYFQAAGYDKDQAYELLNPFIQNYPHSKSYPTPEARAKHFKDQRRYLKEHPDYTFECSYMLGMRFAGSAFDCRECQLNGREKQKEKPVENGTMLDEIDDERAAIQQESTEAEKKAEKNTKTAENRPLDFPDVMTGLAGDYASLYGDYLESPNHFFYMAYLTVLGLAVSDRLYLLSQRRPQPRLFTILLGESAEARKSTVLEESDAFFRGFFQGGTIAICRGAASGEGMAKLIAEIPKVLLYYDELKVFVNKCNVKQSTLLPATNTLFEANRDENRTSKDPIVIEDAYVSMLAASTTDTYAGIFNSTYMDIGFTNRLFLVPGDTDKCFPIPAPIPQEKIRGLYGQLKACLQLVNTTYGIPLEQEAKERWAEFYKQLRGSSLYTKRLDTYGLRLMPLLAVNDMKNTVDTETIEKVVSLIEWQHTVRHIYDPIDAEGKVATMEERIRRKLMMQNKWTKRDLQRAVNYNQSGIWVWDKAEKNLRKNDEMEFNAKSKVYTGSPDLS